MRASNTATDNRRSRTPYGQDHATAASWTGDKGFVSGFPLMEAYTFTDEGMAFVRRWAAAQPVDPSAAENE